MTDTVVIEKVDPLAVPSRFFVIKSTYTRGATTLVVHQAVFGPAHKSEIDAYLLANPCGANAAYLIAEDVTNGA